MLLGDLIFRNFPFGPRENKRPKKRVFQITGPFLLFRLWVNRGAYLGTLCPSPSNRTRSQTVQSFKRRLCILSNSRSIWSPLPATTGFPALWVTSVLHSSWGECQVHRKWPGEAEAKYSTDLARLQIQAQSTQNRKKLDFK